MKAFEEPKFEIRIFEDRDIIVTSPIETTIDEGEGGPDELPIH